MSDERQSTLVKQFLCCANKRVLRLDLDGGLEVVYTVDGLADNLLVTLSDFAAGKQAKISPWTVTVK